MSDGKFSKHIGDGEKVEIDGDEFILKPAGIDVTARHLFKIASKLQKKSATDGDSKDGVALDAMDDEFADAVAGLIIETLKVSYPDEPETDMKQFGMKYMFMLMEPVMKLYSVKTHESSKYAKIEALRKKRADDKAKAADV